MQDGWVLHDREPPNGSFLYLPCLVFWAAPGILPKDGRRPEGLLPRISRSPSLRCVWSPRPHLIGSRRGGVIRANGFPALASLSTGPRGRGQHLSRRVLGRGTVGSGWPPSPLCGTVEMGEGKHAGKQRVCARCVSPPLVHVRCESGFVMVISRALASRDRVPQGAPSPSQGPDPASTPDIRAVCGCGIRRRRVSSVSTGAYM